MILVRGTDGFPEGPEDGTVIYEGTGEKMLDRDVVKDAEYFYALFADFRTGFPEVLYARAIAGADPADTLTEAFEVLSWDILSEGFNVDGFVDLQGCQLEFTPIGAPTSPLGGSQYYTDYSQYEATVTKGVTGFPVPREDERGGAYRVQLKDLSGVYHGITAPFPFFGGRYTQLWLSTNGYVSFQRVSGASTNNFPSLEAHFAMPRISFLFAHLSPDTGGEIWTRSLDDRLVITFDTIPEWLPYEAWYGVFPDGAWPNSVQLELFYSGKIRITYVEVYATNVVCGLSDGNGVPLVLADVFPEIARADYETNLSALPASPSHLSLKPLPYQWVEAGEVVNFVAETVSPNGVPWLSAEWDGPVPVPFADNGDGTGEFYWASTLMDDGTYTVRVKAFLGSETAYQDVTLYIGDPDPLPVATDVRLRSESLFEDPSEDRLIDVNSRLTAEYTYWHPLEQVDPGRYSQGIPLLYWFKNEGLIPAFTNQWMVPANATRAGEKWFFTIIPRTVYGVRGEEVMSPVVTIVAMPTISEIAPTTGPTRGETTVTLTGERLGRPSSVTFGAIPVQHIRSVSDTQIEVVTPAHAAGVVDIVVTTPEGTAVLGSGFSYADDGADIIKADVNGDGVVDALDVQLVLNAVLDGAKGAIDADANRDGLIDSIDIQVVVNEALGNS